MAPLTEGIRDNFRIKIVRGAIYWLDSSGKRIASVEDFDFEMEPMTTLGGRRLYYCAFSAGNVVSEEGTGKRDVRAEWLCTPESPYIEVTKEEKQGFDADETGKKRK